MNLISEEDIGEIDKAQKEIGMRFEKSNEMIQNCNTIMNNHLQIIGPQLTEHTKTVKLLKSDLDQVFSRIRGLKTKIRAKYPDLLEQAEKEELEKMPPPPDE